MIVSVNISYALFPLLSTLGDAGLGLALSFICELRRTLFI